MNSRELVRLCLLGDRNAQRHLFDTFVTAMLRVCQRYIPDKDVVQDVLMEAFMKVFDHLKEFEFTGEHSLNMWIRRIMINECLMKIRKERNVSFVKITDDMSDLLVQTSIPDSVDGEELVAIIHTLPPGYRAVFNLYVVDGYSHKEIATLLNITESASRSQLTHARARLKTLVSKHGWT